MAGLWLRLRLRDGDALEGLGANDASLLEPAGLFLAPPDIRSNTQRIFVPRTSISELAVVAVIGAPPITRTPAPALPTLQEDLFPET